MVSQQRINRNVLHCYTRTDVTPHGVQRCSLPHRRSAAPARVPLRLLRSSPPWQKRQLFVRKQIMFSVDCSPGRRRYLPSRYADAASYRSSSIDGADRAIMIKPRTGGASYRQGLLSTYGAALVLPTNRRTLKSYFPYILYHPEATVSYEQYEQRKGRCC